MKNGEGKMGVAVPMFACGLIASGLFALSIGDPGFGFIGMIEVFAGLILYLAVIAAIIEEVLADHLSRRQ